VQDERRGTKYQNENQVIVKDAIACLLKLNTNYHKGIRAGLYICVHVLAQRAQCY
jgi:hypothetical protein